MSYSIIKHSIDSLVSLLVCSIDTLTKWSVWNIEVRLSEHLVMALRITETHISYKTFIIKTRMAILTMHSRSSIRIYKKNIFLFEIVYRSTRTLKLLFFFRLAVLLSFLGWSLPRLHIIPFIFVFFGWSPQAHSGQERREFKQKKQQYILIPSPDKLWN